MLTSYLVVFALLALARADDVIHATTATWDEEVIDSKEPVLVEFFAPWCGHCKRLAPEWAQAATDLKGIVKLVAVDATVDGQLAERYGVRGYPTIKFFAPGEKDAPTEYDGGRTAAAIVDWCMQKAEEYGIGPEVKELTDQDVFQSECLSRKVCVVAVLPHLIDGGAEARNKYIATLQGVMGALRSKPISAGWIQGGVQEGFEKTLGLGGFGYPALVCISEPKMRFAIHRRAFEEAPIKEFLRDALNGKGTAPLKAIPELATVEAWDGGDYVEPPEETYDE